MVQLRFSRPADTLGTVNLGIVLLLAATAAAVSVAPAVSSALPETLTVSECVGLARVRAPEPAIAAAERDAALLDSSATFRARRAAFSLAGGATLAPRHFYDPAITNLGEYSMKLGVTAPLADGGARQRNRQRSALAAGESRVTLEQASRDAGLRAGWLALEWLRLDEAGRLQEAAASWLEHLAAVMESGVRSGVRGRADALRATLERDAAAAALELTRRDAAAAARELARLLGTAGEVAPAIREDAALEPRAPDAGDSLGLFAAIEAAPEVRLAVLGESRRRLDLESARRRQAWQLDLSADAGIAGTDLTRAVPPDLRAADPEATLADRLRRDLGGSLSLQVRRPLFDGAAKTAAAASVAANRAQQLRRTTEADAQRRLALDLLARWRSASRRFRLTVAVAGRAEEHLLRMESLHAAGATTLLELLDARRALDDARERLADTRAEVRMARLEAEVRR